MQQCQWPAQANGNQQQGQAGAQQAQRLNGASKSWKGGSGIPPELNGVGRPIHDQDFSAESRQPGSGSVTATGFCAFGSQHYDNWQPPSSSATTVHQSREDVLADEDFDWAGFDLGCLAAVEAIESGGAGHNDAPLAVADTPGRALDVSTPSLPRADSAGTTCEVLEVQEADVIAEVEAGNAEENLFMDAKTVNKGIQVHRCRPPKGGGLGLCWILLCGCTGLAFVSLEGLAVRA